MAKKKQKETKDTPTVAAKAVAKVAAEVLRQNPDMNEVHVTSDGTPFYTRNDAQNHANSLQNREVFSTKRSTLVPATSGKAPDKSESADKADAPDSDPESDEVDELTGGGHQ